VCLLVCVFVCLLATLRKNYWTDLHENFITDVHVHKEELVKFCKSSAFGSGSRNFLTDSSTLRDTAFSAIRLISPERVIGFSWKFYHRCILGQGDPCYILEVMQIESPDSGSRQYSPCRAYAVSSCSCLSCESFTETSLTSVLRSSSSSSHTNVYSALQNK